MIYGEDSLFFNEFEEFRKKHGIPGLIFNNKEDWLRDRIFETFSKLYFTQKKTVHRQRKIRNFPPYLNEDDDFSNFYPVTNRYLSLIQYPRGYYDKHDYMTTNRAIQCDFSIIDQNKTKETARPLEGGNLFEAVNIYGETYYIIGVNALLNEIDIERYKTNNIKYGSFMCWSMADFERVFAEILMKYKKIFNTPNVIYIPQWVYHLDLMMAYFGNSTFGLQCFQEGQILWNYYRHDPFFTSHEEGPELREFIQNASNERDPGIYKSITDTVAAKLEACGFKVIRFGGCIYRERSQTSKEKAGLDTQQKWFQISSGDCLMSAFTNGFHYYDANLFQHYFVTLSSPLPFHEDYLRRLLKPLQITPIFIDINTAFQGQSIFEIEGANLGGAVRCQMNWIGNNKFTAEFRRQWGIT